MLAKSLISESAISKKKYYKYSDLKQKECHLTLEYTLNFKGISFEHFPDISK